jgi:hypothetical protein
MANGFQLKSYNDQTATYLTPAGEKTISRLELGPEFQQEIAARESATVPDIGPTVGDAVSKVGDAANQVYQWGKDFSLAPTSDLATPTPPATPLTVTKSANQEQLAVAPQTIQPVTEQTSASRMFGAPNGQRLESALQQRMTDVGEAKAKTQDEIAVNQALVAQSYQDMASMAEAEKARQQQAAERRAKAMVVEEKKQQTLEDDFKKADIKSYWANKSTGETIGLAIAQAMGAFGASLAKTPNFAAQIIDNAIQQDLNVQRANVDKKRGNVEIGRGALARAAKVYDDEESRYQAAYATSLSGAESQIKGFIASAKTAEAKGAGEEILAQVGLAKAERNKAVFEAQQRAAAANQSKALERYKRESPVVDARALDEKELGNVVIVGGQAYLTRDDMQARKIREGVPSLESLTNDIDTVVSYMNETNPMSRLADSTAKTDRYGAVQSKALGIKMKLKDAWNLGVLSDQEYKRMDAAVPDPTDMFVGSSMGRFGTLREETTRALNRNKQGLQKVSNLPGLRPTVQVQAR